MTQLAIDEVQIQLAKWRVVVINYFKPNSWKYFINKVKIPVTNYSQLKIENEYCCDKNEF